MSRAAWVDVIGTALISLSVMSILLRRAWRDDHRPVSVEADQPR